MWTVLVVVCLIASLDANAEGSSLHGESSLRRFDSSVAGLRTAESIPNRLPRKFRENSRTRRLHIENQHGFDGKVDKIHINSEEDLPGVRAYGLQKSNLENNGHIEKTIQKGVLEEIEDSSRRVTRSVTMELVMWIIFAGVSILMTTTFVLEDIYFRKNDPEKLEQLLMTGNGASSNNNGMSSDYNNHDKLTISESKH